MTQESLKSILKNSDNFVFLTGAGISEESGIPTFRGPGGLWKKYDPMKLASISGFYEDPRLVWEFYQDRQKLILGCEPNLGHLTIAEIERLKNTTILTQNIDGLHRRAGSKNIVELHGNIMRIKCTGCNFKGEFQQQDIKNIQDLPPICKSCRNILRPEIVFFGEPLDQQMWKIAEESSGNCSVMFIVGTSLNVGPVNTLPLNAKRNGATLIEMNPEPTIFNNLMDFSLRGKATETLPKILSMIKNV